MQTVSCDLPNVGTEGPPYSSSFGAQCSTTANYTVPSTYGILLGNLRSATIGNRSGFNYPMVGEATDTVFGLVMCFADITWDQCEECLRVASNLSRFLLK